MPGSTSTSSASTTYWAALDDRSPSIPSYISTPRIRKQTRLQPAYVSRRDYTRVLQSASPFGFTFIVYIYSEGGKVNARAFNFLKLQKFGVVLQEKKNPVRSGGLPSEARKQPSEGIAAVRSTIAVLFTENHIAAHMCMTCGADA